MKPRVLFPFTGGIKFWSALHWPCRARFQLNKDRGRIKSLLPYSSQWYCVVSKKKFVPSQQAATSWIKTSGLNNVVKTLCDFHSGECLPALYAVSLPVKPRRHDLAISDIVLHEDGQFPTAHQYLEASRMQLTTGNYEDNAAEFRPIGLAWLTAPDSPWRPSTTDLRDLRSQLTLFGLIWGDRSLPETDPRHQVATGRIPLTIA
ncbi:hypothetical protein ACOME3_010376 [Neoechinorhynchus agilis]